ncbi:MAG: hypothetical protein C4B59_17755, partial [Candidatus Methanogaster sp.]
SNLAGTISGKPKMVYDVLTLNQQMRVTYVLTLFGNLCIDPFHITVSNPESAELGYQVYLENQSIDWIKISDPEFSLKPDQKKQITVRFNPTVGEVGEFDAKVCVVTLQPSGGFNIGSGVKIPVHITIGKSTTPFYTNPIIIVLILSGLLIILLCVRRLRRS